MIKNWQYFKDTGALPYSAWISVDASCYKVVPLSGNCSVHVDGFDCYVSECECEEFKLVCRSQDEIDQIRDLQKAVQEDATLERAKAILDGRQNG